MTKQKSHKNGVLLVLFKYYWTWHLPCIVNNIAGDTPLVKTEFSFASCYQSEMASWLRVGLSVYFLLSCHTAIIHYFYKH